MMRTIQTLILFGWFLIPGLFAQEGSGVVTFDHDLHVNDVGLRCTKCHNPKLLKSSMSSADVILPTEKRCMKCHQMWRDDDECETCHLGSPPYGTFPSVTRIFNFPHKVHWGEQKIDCSECHSDMAGVGNSPPIPTMKECLACHQERQGPQNCDACHENVALLRPHNHTPTWLRDHDVAALANTADCQLCHTQLVCDNCHSGAMLGRDDLPRMNPVPTYRPGQMVGKQLLARNHALDYVYNHGLEANTKARDCRICHEAPEFCTDCHQNKEDQLLNKPNFHGGPEWGAVVYPPGTQFANITDGGIHAQMARRDIELCQSCHDTDGADPICLKCHTDKDGLRGTDPKTHVTGYMQDVYGDWHSNSAALCFTCHTSQKKGIGFCGYCHQ